MLRGMITVRAEFTNFAQPQSVVFHLRPERPSQVWSYDLVQNRTHDGCFYRTLNIIDGVTKEAPPVGDASIACRSTG
jgi:hypothetical protein